MQPYFLPYIGYFQLIHGVDEFIIYDNIQFSKKGWFHRNRMLQNGKDEYFSLTLKKDSDYLNVDQRFLSDQWGNDREKILRKITENYKKAPYFSEVFPFIETIFNDRNTNLFEFLYQSILKICDHLNIKTKISISSHIAIDHTLRSQDKVIALAKAVQATTYLNPIGGYDLYNTADFKNQGLKLEFHKAQPIKYPQFNNEFVHWLSILDLLMFNSKEQIMIWLDHFDILNKDE